MSNKKVSKKDSMKLFVFFGVPFALGTLGNISFQSKEIDSGSLVFD